VQYDVITGVSAGAMNGAGISLFAIGDEVAMADWIIEMWSSLKNSDIYKNWALGILEGLLFKSGIYNNDPLLNLITNLFEK
jgi:predicted acylesterase/phospholipase RssA